MNDIAKAICDGSACAGCLEDKPPAELLLYLQKLPKCRHPHNKAQYRQIFCGFWKFSRSHELRFFFRLLRCDRGSNALLLRTNKTTYRITKILITLIIFSILPCVGQYFMHCCGCLAHFVQLVDIVNIF